ncbi:MAG: nucleotidyltransferase family protein [Oscillospiraceae bacterium]|jgi:predicted nucleotidyltransferase|nr:nucleotidyltransferase family protein [Oscillospiraceae bacterium]
MKAVGIICELNPAHAGHAALASSARAAYPGAAVIGVMSPNFVQRGEAAAYPKHTRAARAVEIGIDLVLELPTPFALSSAEAFARAGVALMISTGVVGAIAFGSESGEISTLRAAAAALSTPECEELTREGIKLGLAYGAARQRALDRLFESPDILQTPNNMLAVEYIRAARSLGADIEFFTRRREPGISSAAIRRALRESANDAELMLPEMLDAAALSRLRTMTLIDFLQIQGSGDGIAERTAAAAKTAGSLAAAADLIKTKRYAHSRVRRFLLCAALGVRGDLPPAPPYIRPLAANEEGRALLREMKRTARLPIVTQPAAGAGIGEAAARMIEIESAATDLYNLGYPDATRRIGGAEWRTSPVML